MIKTSDLSDQLIDKQTQFGNSRILNSSDSIFVFKQTESDYEEPSSDDEVRYCFLFIFVYRY